jgi:tetratricopeptide (TPR) repeat protein
MNLTRGAMAAAMGAVLAIGACAPAATTVASGPVLSPSGEPYAPGIRPRDTRQTGAAQLYLVQAATADPARASALYQQALEAVQPGMQTDSTNATYFFIAAQAHAGLGNFEVADSLFDTAQRLYPAYELEIDPAREQAWAMAFNRGIEAYQANDMATAATAWRQANRIYNKRSEGYLNLAVIYTQNEDYDQAAEAYRQALAALGRTPARELAPEEVEEREEARAQIMESYAQLLVYTERFAEAERLYREYLQTNPTDLAARSALAMVIARQGNQAEARRIYDELMSAPDLTSTDLFNIGVGLFNAEDYERAAQAFRRVTEMSPNNRDAWFNLLNSLYAGDRHADVVPVGQRMLEIDPLNQAASAILGRAYRETRQNQRALEVLTRMDQLPVYVRDLQFRPGEGRSTLSGTMEGHRARAGAPIRLEFTFFGPQGPLGTQTVTVNAPAAQATAPFEVTYTGTTVPVGYRYRLLP